MDLLLANFPDRFTVPKAAEELRKPPTDLVTYAEECGDEGETLDEAEDEDEVWQCDPDYLVGVAQMLQWIADGVQYYLGHREGIDKDTMVYLEFRGISDYEKRPEEVLEHLVDDIAVVKPMVKRLKEHPELFDDARTREQFFDFAVSTIKEALEFAKVYDEWDKSMEKFSKLQRDATVSAPINPALGEPYSPWQSWCRNLPLQKNSPIIKALLAKHEGLQSSTTQLFPHQGLLIAERRRQKVEAIVTDIVEHSAHPEVAQTQMPPNKRDFVAKTTTVPGVNAVVSQVMAQPKKTELNAKNFAFGEQTPMAARARLMAQLDDDCTTRREKLAIFYGTFLNAEEMEAAQKAAASNRM